MAKEKEKIIGRAQTFIRKGQLDKAIKEYQRAIEVDKKDVRLYMKLGDLFAKKKSNNDAVNYYLQAAKYLTKDGFYSRAAAVYRQILQIDDSRIEVLESLADLYNKLGLNTEAMGQYQRISAHYEKEGRLKESLEIVQRMLDLDPRNVVIATKLAELYYKNGMKEQGYQAFRVALDQLREEGRYEQYVKLLEKLAKADPDNTENLKELGDIYMEHERWDRAYAVLARIHQNLPEETEPLSQLADAALKAGRPDDSVQYLKTLAGIYKSKGLKQRAKESLRRVLQIRPDDPEALSVAGATDEHMLREEVHEEIEEVIEEPLEVLEEAEPEEEVLLEAGEPIEEAGGGALSAEQVLEHLTEAGVYLKYGLRDKAMDHIRAVFKADPDNLQAHLKLKDVHIEAGDMDKAVAELEWVVGKALQKKDVESAIMAVDEWLRLEPDSAKAKNYKKKVRAMAPAEEAEPVDLEEAVPVEEEEVEVAEEVMEETFEAEEVIEEVEEEEEAAVYEEEDVIAVEEEPEEVVVEEEEVEEAAASADFEEELEEAEFYLQQGLQDEAKKIYLSILAKDPTNEAAHEKMQELEAAEPEEVVVSEEEAPAYDEEVVAEETVEEPEAPMEEAGPPAIEEAYDETVEADFGDSELEIEHTTDEAPRETIIPEPPPQAAQPEPPEPEPVPPEPPPIIQEPAPPPAAEKPAPPPIVEEPTPPPIVEEPTPPPVAEKPPPPQEEKFDIQAEVAEGPSKGKDWFVEPAPPPGGDLFGSEGEESGLFDLAAELEKDEEGLGSSASLGFGTAEEFSFEETFQKFKQGVAQTISEHDSQTHYDLGIAYKEMGLTSDAVQEFLVASRDPNRYADCMVMATMILRESGDLDHAFDTCKNAVSSGQLKPQEKAALFFELGQVMDKKGEKGGARWALEQGFALNPDFPELDRMLAGFSGIDAVPIDLGESESGKQPPVETGPPPSREQTSWEKAALDQTQPQEDDGEEDDQKKKKRKKISYV